MSRSAPETLLHELNRLLHARSEETADGDLLRRFLNEQDEKAFAELVRRHGRLVLGVARRITGHSQDSEDVFQATFLVLARKAGSLRREAALSAWLHGVSLRLARKAVVAAARRHLRERRAALPERRESPDEGAARELRQQIDAEIASLPESLRVPVVHCLLEGQTQEQAAQHLGWPSRTLKARLHRARALLRRRLQQRGITAAALPAIPALGESIPRASVEVTVRLAILFARGPGGESTAAVALATGGIHMMFWMRMKVVLAVVLLAGLIGLAAGLLQPGRQVPAAAPPRFGAAARKDLYGDPLPPGALVRLGTSRLRHPENFPKVQRLAFARDGKALYSVNAGALRVWDALTGRLEHQWSTGDLTVRGATFSPDGRLVALADLRRLGTDEEFTGIIRILNTSTGKPIRTFLHAKEGYHHLSMTFSPKGKILASLGGSGIVRLQEVATGTEVRRHRFPENNLFSVAFSRDGSRLLINASPNGPFLWDWNSRKEPEEIKISLHGAFSVDLSPNGKILATGGPGRAGARLWDVASGRLLVRLEWSDDWQDPGRNPSDSNEVCFSPDGRYVAVTSRSRRTLGLFSPVTGKEVRRMAGLDSRPAMPVFSPDSRRQAALTEGVIRIHDVATGKNLVPDAPSHRQPPTFVALLKDGTAITTGDDGQVLIWDAKTGRRRTRMDVTQRWVRGAVVSPDGRWLATSELHEDTGVRLWDLRTGREVHNLAGHGRLGGLRALAFTPDSKQLVSWGDDMLLRRWDVQTGKAVAKLQIRPDGRRPPFEWEDRDDFVNGGTISRDGALLVVDRQALFVFDTKTGKQKFKTSYESNAGAVGMAVSPDGRYLLASFWGKSKLVAQAGGQLRRVWGNTFACLFDLTTGKVVHRIELTTRKIVLPIDLEEIRPGGAAFSADGKTFAVGVGRCIKLYATATAAPQGTIDQTPGMITALAFSADGKRIIAGLSDTTAVIWKLPEK